jgi:hypothetical protein
MLQRVPRHSAHPLRLVVETDDPALAIADFGAFADDFDVVYCGGPHENDPCPAVEGQPCPLVEDSDVVLNQINDHEAQRTVVRGVRTTSPGVPMVVTVTPGFECDLPEGCVPMSPSTSVNGQAQALRRAATQRSSHS